jgi:hypothetical protein
MAIGKKTGGRDWQKGFAPNPNGRPKVPAEIKQLRQINANETTKILNKFILMQYEELVEFVKAKQGTAIEMLVGTILLSGIKEGDQGRLGFFLDRLIGKTPENVNVNGNFHVEAVAFIDRLRKARDVGGG